MIVIGTAGHIDHGKSSIVKRLTGVDPDRLPEEKARGMTIDLGFAFYDTPNGHAVAFVDVPGHERFVRNMIAGAGGIDAVALVVAADDGWMPQSEEHFQVVRLLGVKRGLIVINKIDLADDEWVELLVEDVKDKVAGSFLEGAPIVLVSAHTGQGFDDLAGHLDELAGDVIVRADIGKPRLYVDRSFIQQGMGGVVTGTLRGGSLTLGQNIAVWPSTVIGKIRSLQSNSVDVEKALPGQRTAVALTGVDKELMIRGGVISGRTDLEYFAANPILALSVELLANSPVTLADRRRVLLIAGTTEVLGEIRMFRDKQMAPGAEGIVFFKPDEPVYTLVGDHCIIRLPSPMVTLGGGRVLDHLEHFPRRKSLDDFDYLVQRESGSTDDLVLSELAKYVIIGTADFLQEADLSRSDIKSTLAALVKKGSVGKAGKYYFHPESVASLTKHLKEAAQRVLSDEPHLKGLSLDRLVRITKLPVKKLTILIEYLIEIGEIIRFGDEYNLTGRTMALKGAIKAAHDQIMAALKKEPKTPPTIAKLAAGGKDHRQAIKFIIDSGEGYKCGSDFIFLSETWSEIVTVVKRQLSDTGRLEVADVKNMIGVSRKFAMPILAELDRLDITMRDGDHRIKGPKFE